MHALVIGKSDSIEPENLPKAVAKKKMIIAAAATLDESVDPFTKSLTGVVSKELERAISTSRPGNWETGVPANTTFFSDCGTRHTNVRIVAVVNPNLEERIEEGHFRQNFHLRLAVVALNLTPLRERRDDIPLLAEHFVQKRRDFHRVAGISPGTRRTSTKYGLRVNIRELPDVIFHALVIGKTDLTEPEDLPDIIAKKKTIIAAGTACADGVDPLTKSIHMVVSKE